VATGAAVREIQAKVLLSHVRQPDEWFGLRYSMNLYRGCQHHCIYCDSRSECYGIEDFDGEVLVKANALDLLHRELARKRSKGTVGLGSMHDPYMPLEASRRLTRGALHAIGEHGFAVHVITKSDLAVRDADILSEIARRYAAVSFTITCADDDLARAVEPGAPSPSRRFAAMKELTDRGILAGVTLMPVLPFLEDEADNVVAIVERAAASGASYIVAGFGVTMRDRQRAYFYARLDERFPGLRERYERAFGGRYSCAARDAAGLARVFREACSRVGVATRIPVYDPVAATQPRLL
jgi:DNA repair photolyase